MTDHDLLRLEGLPVYQNKMFATAQAARACPRGDVVIAQDLRSGLVRNRAYDPGLLEYDTSYQNEQAHSPTFQAHMAHVLATVERHFRGDAILEVGCGKGAFLDLLRKAGHDASGIDPAYEGEAPYIVKLPFAPGVGVRGDSVVLRHVLEHIAAPVDFLAQIRDANGGGGRIYIEVPCLDWILRNHAWFDVFYEHVNYFRLVDFARMFATVHETGTLFGGQYIYVVAELGSLRDPATVDAPVAPVDVPADFFASLDRCAAMVRPGVPGIVWGGAAKGVMFAHHMQVRGQPLALAIDINSAKQGCFLAGSALPVLAPREALAAHAGGTDVFVMNSNYLAEIITMGGPAHHYIPVDKT
jgi:SAM-dependent methyltransferase